jgi:8-oxo-dGTP diphosphatase
METIDRVALSVDVGCFRIECGRLEVLLMQRADEPFASWWALPGGIVRPDESLLVAARRVLMERTQAPNDYMEQLYTFGDPDRDPRGRTVSVAYITLLPIGEYATRAGRGALSLSWAAAGSLPDLAFDHRQIVEYACYRLAQKVGYTPLAFRVLPEMFTMADLRALHEAVLGHALHPSNFARQMLARWDLSPISGARDKRTRRPARLYRYTGPPEIEGPPPASSRI